ncbi:MAG: class I SAM-dependent methyltransferase [Deltaproteobacteria bacterium]|nr:class I SAM-dependent methyltransferase [Deltaproteobacteria bacterium]
MTDFDLHVAEYRRTLDRGLSISGEDGDYFSRGRVTWLARRLSRHAARPRRLLDLGCGDGRTLPALRDALDASDALGVDASAASIEKARRDIGDPRLRFETLEDFRPSADRDLVYCSGVLHHVPPSERSAFLRTVHDALASGGWLALWENNPWNPGARWVMHRLPFDRDAVMLDVIEAKRRARRAGLYVVHVDFQFVFPRLLAPLRRLEPWLTDWPIGAQYQVLCRKA